MGQAVVVVVVLEEEEEIIIVIKVVAEGILLGEMVLLVEAVGVLHQTVVEDIEGEATFLVEEEEVVKETLAAED